MKILNALPSLLVAVSCATATVQVHDGFVYPMIPARLLADSLAEKCAVCVKDLRERAYRHLDREFTPGTTVRSTGDPAFIRLPGGNRFTPEGGPGGSAYRKNDRGADIHLPRVVFRFHTVQDHLVGVDKKDYTSAKISGLFRGLPARGRFTGSATIINFSYGDGPAFSYSPGENTIFVHCRLDDAVSARDSTGK